MVSNQNIQTVQTIAPIAGAGIGAIWGAPGIAIGSAGGAGISSLLELLKTPAEIPGPSAESRQLLAYSMGLLEKNRSRSGALPGQISNVQQTANEAATASLGLANAANNLDPIQRERLTSSVMQNIQKINSSLASQVANMDEAALANIISTSAGLVSTSAAQAKEITDAEVRKKLFLQDFKEKKAQAVAKAMGNVGNSLATVLYYDAIKDQNAAKNTTQKDPFYESPQNMDVSGYDENMNSVNEPMSTDINITEGLNTPAQISPGMEGTNPTPADIRLYNERAAASGRLDLIDPSDRWAYEYNAKNELTIPAWMK